MQKNGPCPYYITILLYIVLFYYHYYWCISYTDYAINNILLYYR